jgi:hypothetical protein
VPQGFQQAEVQGKLDDGPGEHRIEQEVYLEAQGQARQLPGGALGIQDPGRPRYQLPLVHGGHAL